MGGRLFLVYMFICCLSVVQAVLQEPSLQLYKRLKTRGLANKIPVHLLIAHPMIYGSLIASAILLFFVDWSV